MGSQKPLYSVCVPTYNRPHEVQRLLSMFAEILGDSNDVEICISDNNEDEKTKEIVSQFKNLNIKYNRWGKNMGYDRNAQKAMELATGEFAHLVSDEVFFTKETLLMLLNALRTLSCDGIILEKGAGEADSAQLLRHAFSLKGVSNYFGSYMALFVYRRSAYSQYLEAHGQDLEKFNNRAFIHLPFFLYLLKNSKSFLRMNIRMDSGLQAVLLPARKSELYILHYYMLVKECAGCGIISSDDFSRFKRNFMLCFPFLLLKIRMYMPTWIYEREIGAIKGHIAAIKAEYSGFSHLRMAICENIMFQKFIPFHLLYSAWLLFKLKVRKDPMTVDLFSEYRKKIQ
jgi:glycosyltransferase involved in cell wall biosynthesis